MIKNITDVFFTRRRSKVSTVAPETIEDGGHAKTGTTATTMADSVRPLLTSMKLFGLYFRRGMEDNVASKASRRWKRHMIYSVVVLIVVWINVALMFSVFKNIFIRSSLVSSFLFSYACQSQTHCVS